MSASALVLWLALAQAPPEPGPALQLAFETVADRPALRLTAPGELRGVVVRREGGELVIVLPALSAPAVLPEPLAPIEDLRFESVEGRLELRLLARPDLPFELRREGGQLLVLFGQRPGAHAPGFPELYRSLFPSGMFTEPAEGPPTPPAEPQGRSADGTLAWGPLSLRPALLTSYVDGQATVESASPARDRYWQVEPQLGLTLQGTLLGGRVTAGYQPVLRFDSKYALVNRTSHLFDLGLEQPVGAPFTLRANLHHARGTLETREVDPGSEYFFDLGRFRRWRYGAGLRFETGGRFDLDLSGQVNQVRFEEPGGFFGFDDRNWTAELGYDLTADVRAGFGYTRERVPARSAPERPEAASSAQLVRFSLVGKLSTLEGDLSAGYERREQPRAGPGGQLFEGLVAAAHLRRELRPDTHLSLSGSRYTTLSAFARDGFFLASQVEALLSAPGPLNVSLRGGLAWQWNDYRTAAPGLAEPRHDRLRGWTVGLGRPLSRWAYVRVDYRKDRRDSNLDAFDIDTYSLIAQIGVGWFAGAGGR